MGEPVRIQRKRTKGWKMPPNTVYVGRPSKWGNPWNAEAFAKQFDTGMGSARYQVTLWFRDWICTPTDSSLFKILCGGVATKEQHDSIHKHIHELRGKNLACFCPLDQPCHADVLLELANKGDHQ